MKKIIIASLLICSLTGPAFAYDSKNNSHFISQKGSERDCYAFVRDNEAFFVFPIEKNESWLWFKKTTKDNHLEYSWEISLFEKKPLYNFGVYLFKPPGAAQQEGSLEKLLKSAKHSVFEGQDFKLRGDFKIIAAAKEGNVIVGVRESKTFKTIFKDKPPNALFLIIKPGRPVFSCRAKIHYQP